MQPGSILKGENKLEWSPWPKELILEPLLAWLNTRIPEATKPEGLPHDPGMRLKLAYNDNHKNLY